MERPTNALEITRYLNEHVRGSCGSELLKLHVIANFRSKSTPEFFAYLRAFYGERWDDSMKKSVHTSVRRIDDDVKKHARNISKPHTPDNLVKYLNGNFVLPGKSRKRSSTVTQSEVPSSPVYSPALETPPQTPTDHTTPKRFK